MADFNHHLKNNKILVFFTIFAFLYMSCFTSCSKPKNQGNTEAAQKSARAEKGKNSEVPKMETASNRLAADSNKTTQSGKTDDPCAGCPPVTDAPAENAGQQKPLTQEELNQKADKLDRYFQALEEAVKEIPRDTFDPQAIVDKVGKDPEALFRWVRDNTYLVPYQGVLRGPVGVLMDRLGNSLDRALLLHELLHLAGYNARLTRGDIKKEQMQDLLNRIHPPRRRVASKAKSLSSDEFKKTVDRYIGAYQLDRETIQKIIDKMTVAQENITSDIEERIAEQAEYVYRAIKGLRKEPSFKEGNDFFGYLPEHWWVQQQLEGRWLDMDPTLAEASLGEVLTEPKETLEPENIQNEAYHLVTIRFILEQRAQGKIIENTALEYSMRASELLGKRIAFQHVFINWPKDLSMLEAKQPADKLREVLRQEKEWLPVLSIGENQIFQSSFDTSGEINKNPQRKRAQGGPAGLAGGLFSSLGGREEETTGKNSDLTAEWVEYEIHSPGHKTRKIRRQIFDLVGATTGQEETAGAFEISESQKMERSLALLGDAEVFIQVCDLSDDYFGYLTATQLLASREILTGTLRKIASLTNEELVKKLRALKPLPGPEYSLASARRRLGAFRDDIYLDCPNILVFSKEINFGEKGEFLGSSLLDFISNEVAVYQVPDKESFFVHLYQGVVDTNAEALILQSPGKVVENVAEILFLSKEQNIEWQTITDPNHPLVLNEITKKYALAAMRQDLNNENILLIPKKPIRVGQSTFFGWWRVNPYTGDTLGMGKKGAGQGSTEYKIMVGGILTLLGESICTSMFAIRIMDAANDYYRHKSRERYEQDIEYAKSDYLKCVAANALTVWTGIWFLEGFASQIALALAQAGGDIISML